MKDTITQSTFTDAMIKNGFSYDGTIALFEHLEQYEQDCDHELEFDAIAFRCDYTEYDNFTDIKKEYSDIRNMKDLERNTTVIQVPNSKKLIIQAY